MNHIDKCIIRNLLDGRGNPSGGNAFGLGIMITWQNGPLGKGTERKEPNGAFVETVIAIAKKRLEFYQNGKFSCTENAEAIRHLQLALEVLDSRTKKREDRGVEGTHQE